MRYSKQSNGFPGLMAVMLAVLAFAGSGCGLKSGQEIPVLMYHHIAPDPGKDIWTVSTAEFHRQITALKAAGYRTILPKDLTGTFRWKFWLPRKPIIITFDDGLLSTQTEAEPILREAGFQAICYLITSFIADTPAGRKRYRSYDCLTWSEVKEMQARGTFTFGIHSHSHALNTRRQAKEVEECRQIFKRKTGIKTRDYSYPHGSAPDPLRQAVINGGYHAGMVCKDQMFTHAPDIDLYRIPRVSVYGGRHAFTVTLKPPAEEGTVCAEVQNNGVPMPVRGILRDGQSGRIWILEPAHRLGPTSQHWCWTNLPPGLATANLQVEVWEQNGLFRYHP